MYYVSCHPICHQDIVRSCGRDIKKFIYYGDALVLWTALW